VRVSLDEIVRLPRNSKGHDLGAIHQSVKRFGYLEPILINEVTGRLVGGHGRVDVLGQLKAGGVDTPKGIEVENNAWMVPVHYVSIPEEEEEAAAIALNRTVELGGWEENTLAEVLSDLAQHDALQGTGFDQDDLNEFLERLNLSEVPLDIQDKEHKKKDVTCPQCGHEFTR